MYKEKKKGEIRGLEEKGVDRANVMMMRAFGMVPTLLLLRSLVLFGLLVSAKKDYMLAREIDVKVNVCRCLSCLTCPRC